MPRRSGNTPQNEPQSLPEGVPVELTTIDQLSPDDKNANKGTPRGMGLLENSIQRNKLGRSVLIDKNRRIIAGNKTAETFGTVGGQKVLVVKTRGDVLIAH